MSMQFGNAVQTKIVKLLVVQCIKHGRHIPYFYDGHPGGGHGHQIPTRAILRRTWTSDSYDSHPEEDVDSRFLWQMSKL